MVPLHHQGDGSRFASESAPLSARGSQIPRLRRFTHPRPYKLIDLAAAAGMSISGVRTAYEAGEVEQVAEALGREPAVGTG